MKNPRSEIRNPNSAEATETAGTNSKPYDLRERTLAFAIRILKISSSLPATPEGLAVKRQWIRSGTSIGANTQEADGAVSKADTRRSFVIAKREAQECSYWLKIVDAMWSAQVPVKQDLDEVEQVIGIL
jgi:four helix bundle protein